MADLATLTGWTQALLSPAQAVGAAELGPVRDAGQAIAARLADGGRLMTFGAGHSWCIAAEFCSRAGGLPGVVAMSLADIGEPRDQWRQLADSEPERDPELARPLMAHHQITGADVVFIVSNSARNGMVVELARLARAAGCLVVALVSRSHAASVASRHPSGARVSDHADFVLDNHGTAGDAAIEVVPGVFSGSTSTIAGALVAQLLVCVITAELTSTSAGFTTLRSANLDPEAAR